MTINEVKTTPAACPVTGQQGPVCPVPHGPKGLPGIGVAPAYFKDPLAFTTRTQADHGSMVGVRLPVPFVQVTEPTAVEKVLRTNPDNYVRGTLYKGFAPFMGKGLLTLNDDKWREHRRVAQPAFTPARVRSDAVEAVAATRAVLDRWSGVAARGEVIDISHDLMNVSARVVGQALIGRDLSESSIGYSEAAAIASEVMYTKTVFGLNELVPKFVPTRYHRRRRWAHRVIDGIVRDVMTARGRGGDTGEDAAGLLLASQLSGPSVADDLRTLLLAGSDTTGQALIWTLYELASHPNVRREVEEEVDRLLGDEPPTPGRLDELVVTRSVVDEALRLHPPVWQFPRDSIGDDELAGKHIPAGTTVLLSAYGTHRSPEHWRDPETFDPARFREPAPDRHRYAYFPFGGGRRMCIGKGLALATIVTTVAMVSRRFRLRLVNARDMVPQGYITLFPRDGVRVAVEERR